VNKRGRLIEVPESIYAEGLGEGGGERVGERKYRPTLNITIGNNEKVAKEVTRSLINRKTMREEGLG